MGKSSSLSLIKRDTNLGLRLESFVNTRTPKEEKNYQEEELKRKFTSMIDEYKNTVMSDRRTPIWVSAELVLEFFRKKGEYNEPLGQYEKRVMTEVIESRKDTKLRNHSNRKGKRFYFVGRF